MGGVPFGKRNREKVCKVFRKKGRTFKKMYWAAAVWDGGWGFEDVTQTPCQNQWGGDLMRRGRERRETWVEWGKEKPAPLSAARLFGIRRQQKTIMWSRCKLSLDFSLLAGFRRACGGCAAFQALPERRHSQGNRRVLWETQPKGCLQNKTHAKSLGKIRGFVLAKRGCIALRGRLERQPVTQLASKGSISYSVDP